MINEKIKKIIETNINEEFKNYDKEIKKNLVNISLNSLNKNIKELLLAIKEKNKDKILFSIHTIKGIFLNTRCFDLAEKFNDSKLKYLSLDEIINKLENSINKVL